jgi:purine-nucleoside phosphorylase
MGSNKGQDPELVRHLDLAGDFVRLRLGERAMPRVAIVLGSGLGKLAESVENVVTVPYEDVPYFPTSTVEGHAGRLVIGELEGTPIVALQGRFHLYEGYDAGQVVFPIRTIARLGVKAIVITNAAGGMGDGFQAGDLMLITDHINLTGTNPLVGSHDDRLGPRFPDMSAAYDLEFRELLLRSAQELDMQVQQGVYSVLSGPSYETPAEVRMLKMLGCDACGMSTIPEVVASHQMGVRVLGVSLISNLAAGIAEHPLTHKEVMETGARVADEFARLIRAVLPKVEAALS